MTSTTPALETLDVHLLDLARAALADELGPGEQPGEFLGAVHEDDVAVSVRFVADTPGYSGWVWTVTLAVVEPGHATVSEVALLPGPDALLPPTWVPWAERIRPGDLGPGDLLPPAQDDPRLVPAYVQSDDPAVEALAVELGIGRTQVMSREGRIDLAERLHDGEFGPSSPMAVAAPGSCISCGFYLPLAGSLGLVSGVCGNEWATADSRLVDAQYGCGAHSDVAVEPIALAATTAIVIDELRLEVHPRPTDVDRDTTEPTPDDAEPSTATVDLDEDAETTAVVEAVDAVTGVEDLVESGAAEDDARVPEAVAAGDVVSEVVAAEDEGAEPTDREPSDSGPTDSVPTDREPTDSERVDPA